MRGKIEKQGQYELFETTHGHQILNLDDEEHHVEEFYAVVKGDQGDLLVHSDADHDKQKTLQEGEFYLIHFKDDPDFKDMPHLFLQDGDQYLEMMLPNGLPTKDDYQKKLIRSKEKISKDKLQEHLEDKD